jgi:hypothetical protein
MKRLFQCWPYVGLLAVSSLGLILLRTDPTVEQRPASAAESICDSQRAENLEGQKRAAFHRLEAKRRIAHDLIAQRLTLLQAAELFLDLNELNPDFHWEGFRNLHPEMSDDERCCRQVIAIVRWELLADPDQGKAVVKRLEAELQAHLRGGALRLRQLHGERSYGAKDP